MKRCLSLAVVFLLLVTFAAFTVGKQEAKKAEPTGTEVGKIIPKTDKTVYELAEWEKIIGKKLTFNEAPELRAMVEAGELPPVEERLPDSVMVMLPVSDPMTIGKYGGIMRSGGWGGGAENLQRMIGYEHNYINGVYNQSAESWEMSPDGREYTFTLRKGLKWSDGVPLTTEDVRFMWEDLQLNDEYYPWKGGIPNPPRGLHHRSGDDIAEFEFYDDYTFKITYAVPVDILVKKCDDFYLFYPAHWGKKYHPKYQDEDELAKILKDTGFETWVRLLQTMRGAWHQFRDVTKPVLTPWKLEVFDEKQSIFVRNPYYMAVDADGNQLPYIDKYYAAVAGDPETEKLKALSGQHDLWIAPGIDLFPPAKDAEKDGKILVTRYGTDRVTPAGLEFNLNVQDEVLRKIFRNKDFRFAASYAINRPMIARLNYFGLVEPSQVNWPPGDPYHDEELKTTAIEYDPEKANKMLDEMGLDKKDSDGCRLRPDGKRLEFSFIAFPDMGNLPDAEIIADNLKAVGVFLVLRAMDFQAGVKMFQNNTVVSALNFGWTTGSGRYEMNGVGCPYRANFWSPLWGDWYSSNGAKGEEPDVQEIRDNMAAHDLFHQSFDPEEKRQAMKLITTNAKNNLWTIGTVTPVGFTVTYNANLGNVPLDDPIKVRWRGDKGRFTAWYYKD